MALTSGSRLGPYEILAPVGAGGMGEVYRAKDTRLDRTVAIKVLPSHLSENPEVRQRFEREAKTISSLSHPHICGLYDVGREGGTDYLVMEFLEGETLTDRLARGPLGIEQTLRYGIEMADALDKAHRQGVVHRDLKPGNVMLTKSGVKLVDFGLAKFSTTGRASVFSSATALPTQAPNLTQEGTILGTFQYMAPEQLEGKEADARTDIFALGSVLYEMATGEKAFSGGSQASLIGAILKDEPKTISTIQPMAPPALNRVVKTCLAKDPDDRWQTAHDVRLQLDWIREGGSETAAAAPTVTRRPYRGWIASAALTSLVVGPLVWLVASRGRTEETPRVIRSTIPPPDNTIFNFQGGYAGPVTLSEDGKRMAFTASSPEGRTPLYVRELSASVARALPDTDEAAYPFWSPDGNWLGFFADGRLKKTSASGTGAPPQNLADILEPRGGTWNQAGDILFVPSVRDPVFRLPAKGGKPVAVTRLDESRGERSHRWPHFLPDGRHFLYLIRTAKPENNGIYLGDLESGAKKLVVGADSSASFAPPGYVLFQRGRNLLALPFDAKRLQVTGEPITVAEEVQSWGASGHAVFSNSSNGVLAFAPAAGDPISQIVWLDREGKSLQAVTAPGDYYGPRLSRDGSMLAVTTIDPQTGSSPDIWVYEVSRGVGRRLTGGGSLADFSPVWSSDGREIAFNSNRKGPWDIFLRPLDGEAETLLLESRASKNLTDWSADGRFLMYRIAEHGSRGDLWFLPLEGSRKPVPFLRSEFEETQARFSPDGKWVAYNSNESGRGEIYVVSFPDGRGKRRISTAGGSQPSWRGDGRELYYLAADAKLMAVTAGAEAGSFAEPKPLFATRLKRGRGIAADVLFKYEPSADGRRFLMNVDVAGDASAPLHLVVNWTAALARK